VPLILAAVVALRPTFGLIRRPRRRLPAVPDRTPDGGGLVPRRVFRALGTAMRRRIQSARSRIVPGIFAVRRIIMSVPQMPRQKTARRRSVDGGSAN
jgi:hypothetical protein